MIKVKFKRWFCYVVFKKYLNGRVSIHLHQQGTHQPIATASVNLPDFEMENKQHVLIKNWSENEGMLDSLIDAGVIGESIDKIETGYVCADLCVLQIKVDHLDT